MMYDGVNNFITSVKPEDNSTKVNTEGACARYLSRALYDYNCCLTIKDGHIVVKNNVTGEISEF